jgi:hypothetical protein
VTPSGTVALDRRTSDGIELLLIRSESLHLDAGEARRIAPAVFREIAEGCVNCECKERCERDLAYDSAGMVTLDWENYCANAKVLRSMCALPWFAAGDRS